MEKSLCIAKNPCRIYISTHGKNKENRNYFSVSLFGRFRYDRPLHPSGKDQGMVRRSVPCRHLAHTCSGEAFQAGDIGHDIRPFHNVRGRWDIHKQPPQPIQNVLVVRCGASPFIWCDAVHDSRRHLLPNLKGAQKPPVVRDSFHVHIRRSGGWVLGDNGVLVRLHHRSGCPEEPPARA